MTQEEIEIMLTKYFWRFVASTKGWQGQQVGSARLKLSRTEYITIEPDEWFGLEWANYVVRYNRADAVTSFTIAVPDYIDGRLMKRFYSHRYR